jgi:sugar O-acyltransferase (sialic acid O-acetyltransferase NeuD family)
MSRKVLIIGGGGNATVIAFAIVDTFNSGGDLEFIGYINDRDNICDLEGYPVVGGLSDIPKLVDSGYYFINSIGRIGVQNERMELIESLGIPDERYVTFIHPRAYVAPTVKLGVGCVVLANATISPGTTLGKNCRVMANAMIGHNNIIGDYCFFAASSCTGAHLKIGNGVFVSLNATLREFLTIRDYSTIGMGAVLLNDTETNEIWVGNPAKILLNRT